MTDGDGVEGYAAEVRRAVAPELLEYTWGTASTGIASAGRPVDAAGA